MVDYSKWKNIEISDDEDDTHPNIDTPSLFRWRHNARIERMEEERKEKEEFMSRKNAVLEKLKAAQERIEELEKNGEDATEAKKSLKEVEEMIEKLNEEEQRLALKERLTPWNVDTISKPGFNKTVVNKPAPYKKEELTEEEKQTRLQEFVANHKKEIQHFGLLRKYEDSRTYLMEHPELTCEDTANYLVIWSINLEMEEKYNLVEHVAHQIICMQYILELAKTLEVDPRACVPNFFKKIQLAESDYKKEFVSEVQSLIARIKERAKEKLDQAMKEAEEEERLARLGPGGLDPVEVYESLPEELQKCFDTQDVKKLQETIGKMSVKDAKYHMDRCVKSGLWVPEKKREEGDPNENETEEIYESTDEGK